MKELERTLKALANRRRLAIVQHLKKNREAKVSDIAGAIKLSVKSTSRHLSILAAADILERDQRSLEVFYYLSSQPHSAARYVISIL